MTQMNAASVAQVRAARPDTSTWLAANAGSGKTRVLTDRVARLLLDAVQPQHILCLTYTKAAASEMQNRLFDRLGEWAMLPDDKLTAALTALGTAGTIDAAKLRQARTLFARAIETPGGLKIQTIHSFCAALLRRFPLEARVSPQFTEIEDRAAQLLRAEIIDQIADGPDAEALNTALRQLTAGDLDGLAKAVTRFRDGFDQDKTLADILSLLHLPADLDENQILRGVFHGDEAALIKAILPQMRAQGGNDAKAADALSMITDLDMPALEILEGKMINASGAKVGCAKIGSFPTKASQAKLGQYMPALEALMLRVEAARPLRVGLMAARKTHALHQFARAFLARYDHEKQARGWLDFDDLIFKARALLTNPAVAAWVLYRIDGGIDHILVDEAQDTSPAQWDVIRKLAAEFSSGEGARADVLRTLFVVGDKKQSIYSFQGADPREFDRMQSEFQDKLTGAGQAFQNLTLEYSFRSSDAILRLVDVTFNGQSSAGFNAGGLHRAFKDQLPGRVDLWPLVQDVPPSDPPHWTDPLDRHTAPQSNIVLADRIAAQIQHMIANETLPDEDPDTRLPIRRPVTPKDFLILVRKRSGIFADIIRACKAHDLPIAGSDRLKVGAELAVRDLGALLAFLDLPEDSLSLATALRSPLFGWDEQALFDLAHGRGQTHLWQVLRASETHPDTLNILMDLRDNVDFLRPYDLIERILTRHQGRRKLLARLGTEAEDGINALLTQALAYERTAVPSLTGFLSWMATDDLEIKRQIDAASDQIRVMTVHGAKGLEAPIVILPETGNLRSGNNDSIVTFDGLPVWRMTEKTRPEVLNNAVQDQADIAAHERARLLYVAMTRAEKWLIVAASGDLGSGGNTWYQEIQAAMHKLNATQIETDGQKVLRLSHGDWHAAPPRSASQSSPPAPQLPDYFQHPAPAIIPPAGTLSPSDLGGAKALASALGQDEDAAKLYGTQVHLALETLAAHDRADWPQIEQRLNIAPPALAEAKAVLLSPQLAPFFAAGTLAEVPISADLGTRRLHGTIDRLILGPDGILAVDFKTNAAVPKRPEDCPEGLLRQMGAYAHGLAQIFAGQRVETAIVWTKTASLMPLPHDMVIQALKATPYLDEVAAAS